MELANPIGIMQGRLLPKYQGRYQAHPVDRWQKEFFIAAELGLDCIEFILDFNERERNPLLRSGGPDEILTLAAKTGVSVDTVCADYFMHAPLHHPDAAIASTSRQVLQKLMLNGKRIGLSNIVIPCVDQSRFADAAAQKRFVRNVQPLVAVAEKLELYLALETDLPPQPFAELLAAFDSPNISVNYDIGNSAAWGYNPVEELACYGANITDIHIKDRNRGGDSVLLGTGNAQFDLFFKHLEPFNYQGPFILQAYRDDDGLGTSTRQLAWLQQRLPDWIGKSGK
jgi:L-ribulose-5-phosphate 3-epimerase UlaE